MPSSTVNLILGPARSGKTELALARFCAALDEWRQDPCGPPHIWISPTPSALNEIRDRLAARAQGAWLNPHTATFATLAQEIISQGVRHVRPICDLEKQRILAHVVDRLLAENKLKHFATVADTPGFLRQVSAAIADLKRRDVWADEFRDRSRSVRDHDFALIYTAYQDHLQEHQLFDAEGRFWAAREELVASPSRQGGESRFGLVVLDGFADFTSAQHDLLRLLGDHSGGLLITLPVDSEHEPRTLLFDKPRRTLEQLQKSFPELHRETASETHYRSAGLAVVERNIFRDEAIPSATAAGLSIIAAEGVQGEIREIARRVKQLLLTNDAQPDEIAIDFPSADDVATRIEEVFDDFGLPLALDSRTRLIATPLVRSVTKLLRLAVEDWPFDLLLDVVGSHRLQLGVNSDDINRIALERCIRRAQLPAGRTLLLEQLREWASSLPEVSTAEIPRERLRLVQEAQAGLRALTELNAALAVLDTRAPLSTWIANLETLLDRVGLLTSSDRDLWKLLKKQLSLIVAADARFAAATRNLDSAELLGLVERVATDTTLPKSTDDVGRVRVMSAERARNLSVKHLFLAGLSEQSYSSAEGPGSLYREAEIQRFTDEGPATNSAEQQTGEAMLLFYDMVTRASDTLTLSYPALDDKGQALTPSPYLTELERCFVAGAISTMVMPVGGTVDSETEPASRSDWRIVGMMAAVHGKQQRLAGLITTPATRQLGRAILRSVDSVASRSRREAFGPFEGLLPSDAARAAIAHRFGAEHLWSPSQLETYAACPYQFFSRQILGLEPLEDIALRSDHLRKGHLLHQVLAAIHAQQPPEESSFDDEQLIGRFTDALERLIQETPLKGLEGALREIERREIHSWAALYAQQELDYRQRWIKFDEPLVPVHFEVRFGPKARTGGSANDAVSVEVPFTLDLGSQQIKLTGQIDRVDMGRVGGVTVFNIIDYKSGKEVKLADAEIAAGRQLQLPLYALAAEQLLFADRQAVALATGYWSIQAGGFAPGRNALLEFRTHDESGLADSPRWGALSESIKLRVAEIIHGVRSAQFPIYNEDAHCTRYCEYSKICRVAQIRSLEKVWISPEEANTQSP